MREKDAVCLSSLFCLVLFFPLSCLLFSHVRDEMIPSTTTVTTKLEGDTRYGWVGISQAPRTKIGGRLGWVETRPVCVYTCSLELFMTVLLCRAVVLARHIAMVISSWHHVLPCRGTTGYPNCSGVLVNTAQSLSSMLRGRLGDPGATPGGVARQRAEGGCAIAPFTTP